MASFAEMSTDEAGNEDGEGHEEREEGEDRGERRDANITLD
jgi:hypothetical protein